MVNLTDEAGKKVGAYSRGMKQRLGLADVLIKKPKIIILDEPTLGLDPKGMKELLGKISDLSKNEGMKWAFEQELHQKIIIPEYSTVMGAFGVALGVKDLRAKDHKPSRFRGWNIAHQDINCTSFHCDGCPNHCEVVKASIQGKVISYWGDRCGKWSNIISPSVTLNASSQR